METGIDKTNIGHRLQKLRHKTFGEKQTLADFEARSGVSRGSVGPIENGKSFPMLDVLAKWLKACELSLTDFFRQFESDSEETEKSIELHRLLQVIIASGDEKRIEGIHINLQDIARGAVADSLNRPKEVSVSPSLKAASIPAPAQNSIPVPRVIGQASRKRQRRG
jgi:transcriptional regulator with XRE-family HTH domain